MGRQAKWNNKALLPAANKHTFYQMHLFPILSLFMLCIHTRCLYTGWAEKNWTIFKSV